MNLDKLLLKDKNLVINKFNCYKIFFACLIETNKLYDDYVIPRDFLCKVGLIDKTELTNLEAEFLNRSGYCLYIRENEFFAYKTKLINLFKMKSELITKKAEEELFQVDQGLINILKNVKCSDSLQFNAGYKMLNLSNNFCDAFEI